MPLPRNLDSLFTQFDRDFLASTDWCLPVREPKPVVSVETYCAMLDSADYITRQNYLLRKQRRKLVGKLRRQKLLLENLRSGAIGLGAVALVLGVSAWLKM